MGAQSRLASSALVVQSTANDWYHKNLEVIAKADELLTLQLADANRLCEHTSMSLCDEVFTIMKASLSNSEGSENSSVLLLGEAGSGKTHIVEYCVQKLRQAQRSLVVLRAHGGTYATDVECIRHLATQVSDQLAMPPRANASFEQGMEWIRNVLVDSFKNASAVVVVLDKFEHFCSRARQTLLYNLFDIAQEAGVRLSIIGTSQRMDVMGCLEKRIKSRFSMRHLHAFLPTDVDGLVDVLMTKLRLSSACGLKPAFMKEFHKNVENALRGKAEQWQDHLDCGRPPSWFLGRCMPISHLLSSAGSATAGIDSARPTKRHRISDGLACMPSATSDQLRSLLLDGLCEAEHLVLLALFRLYDRQAPRTLSTVLHEIQLFHNTNTSNYMGSWNEDVYCTMFDQLVQLKLIEVGGIGNADLAKRYLPCQSLVDRRYGELIEDLGARKGDKTVEANLLRGLTEPIQQWAVRQRRKE